jgi:hypothetical protein
MRHTVCLSLLVPILALAAGASRPGVVVAPGVSLQAVTVIATDEGVGQSGPRATLGPSRAARFNLGTVDTIGGTTYDYQTNGPAYRMLVQTPGKGIHVLFMYSAATDTLFRDRNMRYNFYDYGVGAWNWLDPDFMASGVGVFSVPPRAGYGSMDLDTNGAAVISAHHATTGSNVAPILARDADVGAGIFDYAPGEPGLDQYVWPCIGAGMNGTYHVALLDNASQDNLYRTRMTSWPTWEPRVSVPPPQPEPLSPTHNIATSKVAGSNKVCITWVSTPASGYMQEPGFYRESQDGGDNWDAPVDIGFPLAFGPDTLPSFSISSLFPFYDRDNNLHIVGNVSPYVRDTSWVLPGQIWHWCAANPDTWDLIHIASPDSLLGNVPGNAVICCRPSLGQDHGGNLFVAWEEFDGVNVEPTTNRLRADIWYSFSTDNGITWNSGTKITDGGEVTYRYPSILNPIGDTVMVTYLIDQVAGFFVQGAEGGPTNNPVVVQKWGNLAVAEGPIAAPPSRMEIAAGPNPVRSRTVMSYALPRSGDMSLVVYDAAGRPVQTLAAGRRPAGRYTATWDAGGVPAGIYFCTLEAGRSRVTRKVILTQ